MNFNIYVPDEIAQKLSLASNDLSCSRNYIVTVALNDWLNRHLTSKWPDHFFNFKPIKDLPNFKNLSNELSININEDPLA